MKKVLIIGAAGRDFHNFNTYFRGNPSYFVKAFTATQIPDIENRIYPPEMAGELYPDGIPIFPEEELIALIKKFTIDICVFSYSDISYQKVMTTASLVQKAGASFLILGPNDTMIKSIKPVIAICATRTGCGKSQTTRKIIEILNQQNKKTIVIRHPMPYGDLNAQMIQRFASLQDLERHQCTIEEMEEYEPHIARGSVVYAGVDYAAILKEAENDRRGCDVILWDGGNNDFPFIKPDLMITITDPHRVGNELNYYPGETNLRLADVVIINKIDSANRNDIDTLRKNIHNTNKNTIIIEAASPIKVDHPEVIKNHKVLVVEDGPSVTHGEMQIGAGMLAAHKYGASEIVDPKPFVKGKLAETYKHYTNLGAFLPAMGYDKKQVEDLERTIESIPCDSVIIGTPIDLNRIVKIKKPFTRVHYHLQEIGYPDLEAVLEDFL